MDPLELRIFSNASYRQAELSEYCNNPLIEALPPILEEEEALERMGNPLAFDLAERNLKRNVRLHCVRRLENLVIALPIHVRFESEVSILLRRGYVPRNPCNPQTWQAMASHATAHTVSPIPLPEYYRPSSSSMLLTGLSGIGKSTMLKIILRTCPQVIRHSRYKTMDFKHTQIVWLKIDCPCDGSLAGLCKEFFKAVDQLVGTNYTEQWSRSHKTIPDMQAAMETISSTFFIGLLVIDELQGLSIAKAGGAEKMLNFFVNMINQIGIPIIYVGTYKLKEIFAKEMRQARRASDMGTVDFQRYLQDDDVWNYFIEQVWCYQWVKNPSPLDNALRIKLFDLSQGVTAILISLFAMAQAMALSEGYETVDEDILQKTYDERMKILHRPLNALKSNEPEDLQCFEDLLPLNYNFFEDNIFQSSSQTILQKLRNNAHALQAHQKAPSQIDANPEIPAKEITVSDEIAARDLRNKTEMDESARIRLQKSGILSSDPMKLGK